MHRSLCTSVKETIMWIPHRRRRPLRLHIGWYVVLLSIAAAVSHGGTMDTVTSEHSLLLQGFRLLDTSDSSTIRTIEDGDVIDPMVDGSNLTIVVDLNTATIGGDRIGHVIFRLNDNPSYRIEGRAPYALGGDQNGGQRYYNEPSLQQSGVYTMGVAVYGTRQDGEDEEEHDVQPLAQTLITFTVLHDAPGANGDTDIVDSKNDKEYSNPIPAAVELGVNVPSNPIPAAVKLAVNVPSNPVVTEVAPAGAVAGDVPAYRHSPTGAWTGEARQWHKLTLGWDGPPGLSETTLPFSTFRLDVTFRHYTSGTTIVIPGYYAADGNAANTGATAGRVWLVHVAPPVAGVWQWECSFRHYDTDSSAGYMDGMQGSVRIATVDHSLGSRDHRRKGRLTYVPGNHHLQYAGTEDYFLKVGADSPENFLAYDGFDNTPNRGGRRKDWGPHVRDFREGLDPTWAEGKGKGIIGALNYLALEKGMNAFSFLTMNIGGDDKNVFPYVSDQAKDSMRMDVSKLAQWEVVFEHADKIGLFLHFKLQEQEVDFLLDGGELGPAKQLYYREMVARFSHHLALNWNIGEENGNTIEQRKDFASFLKAVDPYNSPVIIHDAVYNRDELYGGLLGDENYNGASLQTRPDHVFDDTLEWLERSREAGWTWIVANDEQNPAAVGVLPDSLDPSHDSIRKNVLWGNLMAGGAGVEYYFGNRYFQSDLTCVDYRSRENMWTQSKHAHDFFSNYVPFWTMRNQNSLLSTMSSAHCLANHDTFVIYFMNKEARIGTLIDLPEGVVFHVQWFDPVEGGNLQVGTHQLVRGRGNVWIGDPPTFRDDDDRDWVAFVLQIHPRNGQ